METDSLQDSCGVVGIYSPEPINIPSNLFFPLFALQHRGQESAGISYMKDNRLVTYKDVGMVGTVLSRYLERERYSTVGIGHVRYSTQGGNKLENAQPMAVSCNKGEIALAHNGNISNSRQLKAELFEEGSIFQSTGDSELILHLLSRSRESDFYHALAEVLPRLEGAFSIAMIHNGSLLAIRDPRGFRPLYVGWKGDMVVTASETCALDILKVDEFREVQPGEIVIADENGVRSERISEPKPQSRCVFELIYFARPDSQVFGESVHLTRKRIGAALATNETVSADLVLPVPDSGNSAALGFAEASGLPLELGLTRNHYSGRSFIMPTTAERELMVRMKLHPIREAIRDKRLILIDDSLVRGTTSRILVTMLKEAGAAEIHLRLASPEIIWPCFFGIDIPTREELISNHMDPGEIAGHIGADSVRFLTIEELKSSLDEPNSYCFACFSGNYPIPVESGQPPGVG
ncbi:MAG: amidophosphoribosyltransferase [Spirochaetales bacterium]|nr:amidophosphoribosyltransferase [Spirochaetales bacterium]MCF7938632.1 amidophosphoribosyltransferase [Spirochaetales bacterium]